MFHRDGRLHLGSGGCIRVSPPALALNMPHGQLCTRDVEILGQRLVARQPSGWARAYIFRLILRIIIAMKTQDEEGFPVNLGDLQIRWLTGTETSLQQKRGEDGHRRETQLTERRGARYAFWDVLSAVGAEPPAGAAGMEAAFWPRPA